MNRTWLPTSLALLLLATLPTGCAEDAGTTPVVERPTVPAAPAADIGIRNTDAGTLVITDASGAAVFTLCLDGSHVELTSADGERLAVLTDKESAVAAALAHELAPVSVH